ncbi:DUF5993 family protein [Halodesulfovibrio sp.]|uniref:DUF5993 family protein n=1 Tax=Halodesulfovibrio sp. TaxID=1912772 RepID=UPI00342D9959
MSTILFSLLILAMGIGWYGHRMGAIYVTIFSIALAVIWFMSHATDSLNINL